MNLFGKNTTPIIKFPINTFMTVNNIKDNISQQLYFMQFCYYVKVKNKKNRIEVNLVEVISSF